MIIGIINMNKIESEVPINMAVIKQLTGRRRSPVSVAIMLWSARQAMSINRI